MSTLQMVALAVIVCLVGTVVACLLVGANNLGRKDD